MKKILLMLAITACTITYTMQERRKAQLSRATAVKIEFADLLESDKIRNDIAAAYALAAYKPDFRPNCSYENAFWVWIYASESEIKEQFKNKKWASQMKEFEGDGWMSAANSNTKQ